jgi:hypothetical protein
MTNIILRDYNRKGGGFMSFELKNELCIEAFQECIDMGRIKEGHRIFISRTC